LRSIELIDESGPDPVNNLTGWEEVDCILCREKGPTSVFWPDKGRGDIVRCLACGLVFRTPRRLEQSIGQDFAEQWTESRPLFSLIDYREKNLSKIARWVLDRHPAPGSVLDIGSSYGTLLGMFPESWIRVGIEPSGTACQVARERLPNAQIIHSLLGEASLPDASFDVITLVDTVYYLPYPLRDLMRVKRLLKPGGMLIIEGQNFANRGYVYRWLKHPFSDTWMYFYTPATLKRMLGEVGMRAKASFSLPGHQVGAKRPLARFLTWTEYYLTESISKISAGRVNLTPHFVLVATLGHNEPRLASGKSGLMQK
jgi:SAM-dependent methyltransferase